MQVLAKDQNLPLEKVTVAISGTIDRSRPVRPDVSLFNSVRMQFQLTGKGAFVREVKLGASIKRKQQWMIRAGDVVYNKLFAWKGTFAIADQSVDGCIVSDKFPTYTFDVNALDPQFLALWFRSPQLADQAREFSKGAAALSKLTLNPPDFWKLTIPLPDLTEQKRIVTQISTLLKGLDRIRSLRSPIDAVVQGRRAGIGSEIRLLMSAALHSLNQAMDGRLGILDDVLTLRPRSGPSFVSKLGMAYQ